MSNIKFRAREVITGEIFPQLYQGQCFQWVNHEKQANIVIEQFTGAFDTNSKEMYTGDKVRVDGLGTCTVAVCPYYGVVFVDSTGDEHPMIDCMAENDSFVLIEGVKS